MKKELESTIQMNDEEASTANQSLRRDAAQEIDKFRQDLLSNFEDPMRRLTRRRSSRPGPPDSALKCGTSSSGRAEWQEVANRVVWTGFSRNTTTNIWRFGSW